MIPRQRIRILKEASSREGRYVLYWMRTDQRTRWNHALEYALDQARGQSLPLLVYAVLEEPKDAEPRHRRFLLEGYRDVAENLKNRGIPFALLPGSPQDITLALSQDAALLITDRGYLKEDRLLLETVTAVLPTALHQVETHVVVPVETASSKEEYSAATLRRKIERLLPEFSLPLEPRLPGDQDFPLEDFSWPTPPVEAQRLLAALPPRGLIPFTGGENAAQERLTQFLEEKLAGYGEKRNDPTGDFSSGLSPYLRYGQISPLEIYVRVRKIPSEDTRVFLDELIVRRELAVNFVTYNPHYDSYAAISSFARTTLEKHRDDPRPYLYPLEELEKGQTHDPYWNAAQLQLRHTGIMPGYLRMYWGKKILEWTKNPEEAYAWALLLNNRYSLDGDDPNSYAGVAWCFGKHDRPWMERPVYGTVRYMNDKGLERKFRIGEYTKKVEKLLAAQKDEP